MNNYRIVDDAELELITGAGGLAHPEPAILTPSPSPVKIPAPGNGGGDTIGIDTSNDSSYSQGGPNANVEMG